MKNVRYFWIQFYASADWQIVKFWTDKTGQERMKALDWALSHLVADFDNKTYVIGTRIQDENILPII